jgi:hypothetical protein
MIGEYKQLVDRAVFSAQDPALMTPEEKKRALCAINLIKEKRCGKIEGRTIADGSQKRVYTSKAETASPTRSLEALFVSLMVDAHEGRAVQNFDVPGAYLQTPMPDDLIVHMIFEGEFVDILCDADPSFLPHVTYEKGKNVLYARVHKAIYGLIESAMLWYDVFTGTLTDMGFELNPYNHCLTNKMIDGSQCTIGWFVDDNKISHKSDKVLTRLADEIESKF